MESLGKTKEVSMKLLTLLFLLNSPCDEIIISCAEQCSGDLECFICLAVKSHESGVQCEVIKKLLLQ
jgi:hypothetical protein